MGKNKMYANKRNLVGKDTEELTEASRKLSDEQLFQMVTQNILKREEQSPPHNRGQVTAQEQFTIIKLAADGERTAI